MTHKELVEARRAEFSLRWPDLGRERLPEAKEFIISEHGPLSTGTVKSSGKSKA